jgi:RNA polymerase sigma-70 factor, ECF subfamily
MDDFTLTPPDTLIAQGYAQAYARHGDLGLTAEAFAFHLYAIIGRRAGANAPAYTACELISRLHLDDLYLAAACAQGSDAAWRCFTLTYGGHIRKVSLSVCRSRAAAYDLADSLMGHVFLPDTTGRCRMASYEGLSPLSAWLAAIIRHRASNERRLKADDMESLDIVKGEPDDSSIRKTEAEIRAGKYRRLMDDSFDEAIGLLSDRERLILCLRFERELRVSDIARQFGVTPHAITQQIDRSGQKLRRRILYLLRTRHRLGPSVVAECVADLLNDPGHAIRVLNLTE